MLNTGTGTNFGFEDENKSTTEFAIAYREFEEKPKSTILTIGTKINGTLVSKNNKYALIDINNKSNVVVSIDPLEKVILDMVETGSSVEVLITNIEDKKEFLISGSLHQLKMIEVDSVLNSSFDNRTIMTGIPTEYNHAGYTVLVNINDETIALFMPHLLTDVNKLPNPDSIIGEEINFILDKINKDGKTSFLASRKAYLNTLARNEIKSLIKGNMYTGHVTGTTSFAIFIQFNGCLTGMIHKSNLSEQAQSLLENNEIQNGQPIEFYVKDISDTKLFLTQIIRDSLWDSIQVNDILLGTVSSIKSFGLLVDLDYETKGLLHESVLKGNITNYKVGQQLEVYVKAVNKNKRQITLALR